MKDCQLLQIMISQMLAGKYNVKGLEAFRIGFATPLASSAQELDWRVNAGGKNSQRALQFVTFISEAKIGTAPIQKELFSKVTMPLHELHTPQDQNSGVSCLFRLTILQWTPHSSTENYFNHSCLRFTFNYLMQDKAFEYVFHITKEFTPFFSYKLSLA